MKQDAPKKKAATKKKATVKKAVSKKAVSKKAVKKKSVSKKTAVSKKKTKNLSYQQRYQMIAEAAYLIAEKQNFKPDNELSHWLEAEIQIDSWIASEKIKLTE